LSDEMDSSVDTVSKQWHDQGIMVLYFTFYLPYDVE